jgi:hypothetical protein
VCWLRQSPQRSWSVYFLCVVYFSGKLEKVQTNTSWINWAASRS